MIWALLAAFLRKRAPWVQAVMVGVCTGLFVAAGTLGVARAVSVGSGTFLVLAIALVVGAAFYGARRAHQPGRARARPPGPGAHVAYVALWVGFCAAAIRALVVAGGPRVAVFAIVPLVLLAEPALAGARALSGGRPMRSTEHPAAGKERPASPRSGAG
jgi:hypothetical protein